VFKSLLKASVVGAVLFTLAWFRFPESVSRPAPILGTFGIFGGFLIVLTLVLGFPLVSIVEKYRVGYWWLYATLGAGIGGLIGAAFSSHPIPEYPDPFAISLSPWMRDSPGLIRSPPITWADYTGSIEFCAIVGAALGASFWYFYSRSARPNQRLERP